MYGPEFRVIPEATASFLTKQFAIFPHINFLTLLSSAPNIPHRCTSFELGSADHRLFEALQAGHSKFTNAMSLFSKRTKLGDDNAEE